MIRKAPYRAMDIFRWVIIYPCLLLTIAVSAGVGKETIRGWKMSGMHMYEQVINSITQH